MLSLAFMGEPVLHKKTSPLTVKELQSAKIRTFAEEFLKTASKLPAAGLAAPQVFKSYRMFCLILDKEYLTYKLVKTSNKKFKEPLMQPDVPFLCINPVVEKVGNETEYSEEACLSIPYYMGIVERAKKVRLSFVDLDNNSYTIEASDFMARVIQHELDHLNGVLWLDRIRSTKDIFFQKPESEGKEF